MKKFRLGLRLTGRVLVGLWAVLVIVGFSVNTFPLFAREIREGSCLIVFGAVIWIMAARSSIRAARWGLSPVVTLFRRPGHA